MKAWRIEITPVSKRRAGVREKPPVAREEILMNNPRFDSAINVVSGIAELVRGQDQRFLEELKPLVRSQSVHLDFAPVERIDAAGLAALITLYCDARQAGHTFTVLRPGRHVREILSVVGLDKILLSRNADDVSDSGIQMAKTAA